MAVKEYISREEIFKFPVRLNHYDVEALRNFINNIPAADVAPVKHGHWDNISESCSVCGSHWAEGMVMNADDWGYFDPMPAYCPYCGAKMDGGENNET